MPLSATRPRSSGRSTKTIREPNDALEFPDGQIVLLNLLEEGQHATVLQLPAEQLPAAVVGTKATQGAAYV
jgi:hypothetical protein